MAFHVSGYSVSLVSMLLVKLDDKYDRQCDYGYAFHNKKPSHLVIQSMSAWFTRQRTVLLVANRPSVKQTSCRSLLRRDSTRMSPFSYGRHYARKGASLSMF